MKSAMLELAKYLEESPLMWMMLLHLHLNLNDDDDDTPLQILSCNPAAILL